MQTIATLIRQAAVQLIDSPTARLDAEVLLQHILKVSASYLRTWPEREVTEEHLQQYQVLLQRRINGEPIAYLTGQREFWSMPLNITSDTLIPRPETECLVEIALKLGSKDQSLHVADLGTGSGAIALALAKERPNWHIYATDIDAASLELAAGNAQHLALPNVSFLQGDWCAALPNCLFDMLVSNPPYIPEHDTHLNQGDVRFEPRRALVAGVDGLHAFQQIIAQARSYLAPQAWLILEHGYHQAADIEKIFNTYQYINFQDESDYAGISRIARAQWTGEMSLIS